MKKITTLILLLMTTVSSFGQSNVWGYTDYSEEEPNGAKYEFINLGTLTEDVYLGENCKNSNGGNTITGMERIMYINEGHLDLNGFTIWMKRDSKLIIMGNLIGDTNPPAEGEIASSGITINSTYWDQQNQNTDNCGNLSVTQGYNIDDRVCIHPLGTVSGYFFTDFGGYAYYQNASNASLSSLNSCPTENLDGEYLFNFYNYLHDDASAEQFIFSDNFKYDRFTQTIYVNEAEFIRIYDLNGRLLVNSNSSETNVSNIQNGVYIVQSNKGNGKFYKM